MKSFNSVLNIYSNEYFFGKNKYPLEKKKELYKNMKEEKLKSKNFLIKFYFLGNEPTIKEIESFKFINIEE